MRWYDPRSGPDGMATATLSRDGLFFARPVAIQGDPKPCSPPEILNAHGDGSCQEGSSQGKPHGDLGSRHKALFLDVQDTKILRDATSPKKRSSWDGTNHQSQLARGGFCP